MKPGIKIFLAILFTATWVSCARERAPFLQPLKPSHKQFANGLELMALSDRELPTAQLLLYIRGGSLYDPVGKEGLASVALQAIRLGGSESKNPEEIEEILEFAGSSLEIEASKEFMTVSLHVLKRDLDQGLGTLFDLLRKPAIDRERFETVKENAKDAVVRGTEDPLTLAYREYPGFVYGEDSPWGRRPTVGSIGRIRYEDVTNFHRQFIHPDRILIAASGDFSPQEILSKIEEKTRDWRRSESPLAPLPSLDEKFEREVAVIPRKGLTQTTILVGHLGAKRDNPDKYTLILMNFILGGSGSLTSRLGEEIRSSAGKAYGVWSDFGFAKDFGLFRAVAQTALENTTWVTRKIEEMISEMARSPDFKVEEVERGKQAILRSLIFNFETRFDQVKEQARFRLYGYPDNYIEIYQKQISKLTLDDLDRVAKKYLHPEGLKVLLVTSDEMVKKMGTVEVRKVEQ